MISDIEPFALIVLVVAGATLIAVLSNRLTARLRIPSPALFLAAAAIVVKVVPAVHPPPTPTVERVVTIALALILFDGGMHIGWSRFRAAALPIMTVGVVGTFLTAAATAGFSYGAFGLSWYAAVLLATAVAPTDPAVVFSVLGRREVTGHGGTILEGESGANDPVGIALMVSLISAGSATTGAFGHVAGEFVLQLGVGAAVGGIGGRALLWFMRQVPLPSEGLYPLRVLAAALALFGVAGVAHGSGFLAVFVAGIVVGDARAPYKREIERFHSSVASLAEIVAFAVLGLTVDLATIGHLDVWLPGLVIGVLLAAVIRPVVVGACLVGSGLHRNERQFVLFAGLKGAVPVLLGSLLLTADVPDPARLYGIVVVVVGFSVLVQGSLVPAVAGWLRVPMRIVEPEPWSVGVRLREDPEGTHRFIVARGSPAAGERIESLPGFPAGAWISLVVRAGRLVPVQGETELHVGDEVLVLADAAQSGELAVVFGPVR